MSENPHAGATRRQALRWLATGSMAGTLRPWGQTALAQTKPPSGRTPDERKSAQDVDLQLLLAIDASGSVNWTRFGLQKQGYVDAFADHRVLDAIRSGPVGAIAVMMYQWTGPSMQANVVPWTRINDENSIMAFSAAIKASERNLFGGGTSVSGAIDYGTTQFPTSPFSGGRRVIDVSGDGSNNRGRAADAARDDAVARGININGLPILEVEPYLEEYYRDNVIGGPGAFVVAAATFADFGTAILRKLILEIAGRTPQQAGSRGGRRHVPYSSL